MLHFDDVLGILSLIGIQGKTSLLPDNEMTTLSLQAFCWDEHMLLPIA